MKKQNIYAEIPADFSQEIFETLLKTEHFQIERILSDGHATPPGKWYDQDFDEWVILLKGKASLRFDGQAEPTRLQPGDYVHIPAHVRHRVDSTDNEQKTVWLALNFKEV